MNHVSENKLFFKDIFNVIQKIDQVYSTLCYAQFKACLSAILLCFVFLNILPSANSNFASGVKPMAFDNMDNIHS